MSSRAGDLTYRHGRWEQTKDVLQLRIPDSVRDAVDARVRPLDPAARRVLQVAAVIGLRFDADVLRAVTGLDEDALASALRLALDAQLVESLDDENRAFAYRHALTRESILADLLDPQRRKLHMVVAQAIESADDPEAHAEELAYHFDAASEPARAYRYHLLAADAATRMPDPARASLHLERAIALAPEDADVASLYLRLAEAESRRTFARAAEAAEEAVRRFKTGSRFREAGHAMVLLARSRWVAGDPRSARETVGEAVALLEPEGETPELAAAYGEVARQGALDQRLDIVRDMAERAIDIARRSGPAASGDRTMHARVEADALITLGGSHLRDDVAKGLRLQREGIAMATRAGMMAIADRGYMNLYCDSEVADARGVWEEWESYGRKIGYRPEQLVHIAGMIRAGDADFDAVLRGAAELTGESFWSFNGRMTEAMVTVVREGPEHGLPAAEAAWKRIPGLHATGRQGGVLNVLQPFLIAGEFQRVLDLAEMGADVIDSSDGNVSAEIADIAIVISALHAARALGDEAALDRWTTRAKRLDGPRGVSRLAAVYVDADALARSDVAGAARLFAEVADAPALATQPVTSTLIRLRAVELFRLVDRAAAGIQLERVVDFWRKGKATWFLGELGRWATAHDLSFPRGPEPVRAEKKQLTEREREIARLVAQGLTNRSIAARLVISERTAEGHIQRILDKLDFRSRAQIAAWYAETRGEL